MVVGFGRQAEGLLHPFFCVGECERAYGRPRAVVQRILYVKLAVCVIVEEHCRVYLYVAERLGVYLRLPVEAAQLRRVSGVGLLAVGLPVNGRSASFLSSAFHYALVEPAVYFASLVAHYEHVDVVIGRMEVGLAAVVAFKVEVPSGNAVEPRREVGGYVLVAVHGQFQFGRGFAAAPVGEVEYVVAGSRQCYFLSLFIHILAVDHRGRGHGRNHIFLAAARRSVGQRVCGYRLILGRHRYVAVDVELVRVVGRNRFAADAPARELVAEVACLREGDFGVLVECHASGRLHAYRACAFGSHLYG